MRTVDFNCHMVDHHEKKCIILFLFCKCHWKLNLLELWGHKFSGRLYKILRKYEISQFHFLLMELKIFKMFTNYVASRAAAVVLVSDILIPCAFWYNWRASTKSMVRPAYSGPLDRTVDPSGPKVKRVGSGWAKMSLG
jgi:hypothetical protein